MVFCSSRAIYLGFFQCPLWGKIVFLTPISNYFKIEAGNFFKQLWQWYKHMLEKKSAIPCNDIIACIMWPSDFEQHFTKMLDYYRLQIGAVEACWAHNPKVRGSKPQSANFLWITLFLCNKRVGDAVSVENMLKEFNRYEVTLFIESLFSVC